MKYRVLQDNIDIIKLLDLLGIKGNIRNDNLISQCPVNVEHEDSTPSFGVKLFGENKGLWNCYGCGMRGNLVHLVMHVKNITSEEAVSLISDWFNLDEVIEEISTKELRKMLEIHSDEEEEILVIPLPRLSGDKDKVAEYLMNKRGYTQDQAFEIIHFYKMDYCNQGYYQGRLIIPIYDSYNVYVTFEAQLVEGEGAKKLYPKGSKVSRLLFNDNHVNSKRVCIVEGIWDAIRLKSYGYPVISVFGANNLSMSQAYKIIKKYDSVVLFFDGDKAGREAVNKAVNDTFFPFVETIAVSVKGKDPDDITEQEAKETLGKYFI